jgi:hypothetical protein
VREVVRASQVFFHKPNGGCPTLARFLRKGGRCVLPSRVKLCGKTYTLKPARPVEVLRELIESNGLKQKDLLDIFSTPSIASEVLREKRGLTVEHIRKLSRRFQVSPKVFF